MGPSRHVLHRRPVESSWLLDAAQLPQPLLGYASDVPVLTMAAGGGGGRSQHASGACAVR